MKILAIDPGIEKVGYAIFSLAHKQANYLASGLIITDKKLPTPERLARIYSLLQDICQEYKPSRCIIERIFMFKNEKTINIVGQAQGAIMLAAAHAKLNVEWLTPLEIKQAVTGFGRADKKAVVKMLELELKIPLQDKEDDETDAIACGLAYGYLRKI